MKRTTPLQKYAAQFRYEHKNMNDRFSGVKKHANELSKLLDGMFPKDKKEKEKKMNVPDLWNFMTSLNKKDKALFEELLDNDNEPLEYKGDVKQGGLLKNKKMIERRVIEKEENGRLRDYTQYRIQPDVYEVLKPSYDQFYSIIGD